MPIRQRHLARLGRQLLLFLMVLQAGPAAAAGRETTFAERVQAQEAIERVYHAYRIDAPDAFEESVSPQLLVTKVEETLRKSAALERRWKGSITAKALARELQRIARHTRFPQRLEQIYDALGRDPVLIQECFVRPILVDRLFRHLLPSTDRPADDEQWDLFEVRSVAEVVPLPEAAAGATCPADHVWDNASLDDVYPPPFAAHQAVWTGTEMILYGSPGFHWSYDPLLDLWTIISWGTVADGPGVWTGTELLVWDDDSGKVGGRYDPVADSWLPLSEIGAPLQSSGLSVVWTGTEMIVWGGAGGDSGRYHAATDTWSAVNLTGAPSPRTRYTAVWTGSEMIIWGGLEQGLAPVDDGARYNPVTDSWSPMSLTGLTGQWQEYHAVWTGSAMLIWTGLQHGALYDPVTNLWSAAISTTNAPSLRSEEEVAWTGSELVVWGGRASGSSSNLNDGARYHPPTDQWTPLSATGAPSPREAHSAVWIGSEVIIWGGELFAGGALDTGGRYDPAADDWQPTSVDNSPVTPQYRTAVWTGNVMVVPGAAYDPLTDAWTPKNTPPVDRDALTFWTGRYMLTFSDWNYVNAGMRYDPVADTSLPMNPMPGVSEFLGTPVGTWTGRRMAVVGLTGSPDFEPVSGFYDPESDSWELISMSGFDFIHLRGSLGWAGSRLVHFGGSNGSDSPTGGPGHLYDPVTDSWSHISEENAPAPRLENHILRTGDRLLVWGGRGNAGPLASGGLYDPILDSWTPMSTLGAPSPTNGDTVQWTGKYFVTWGGRGDSSGGVYDPATDTWTATSAAGAPSSRFQHTSVWTGREMIVWGWQPDGGRYALAQHDDVDGDGLTVCDGDCDDLDPLSFPGAVDFCDGRDNDCDGLIPGIELIDLDFDGAPECNDCDDADGTRSPDYPEYCNGIDDDCNGVVDDADQDGDGFFCAEDCRRFDPDTYPGAPELLDGLDNQCPGDVGYGAIDEVSGPASVDQAGLFCWPAQQGADSYVVARSAAPEFPAPCNLETVTGVCLADPVLPALDEIFYYLVRPLEPHLGSWGTGTAQERVVACGAESSCSNGLDDDGNGSLDCADSGCFGALGCTSVSYSFIDSFADDVTTTSLHEFLTAAQVLPTDYLHFSVGGGSLSLFEWCSESADFYREQYVDLAAGGGSVFSGAWDRWVQSAGAGWTGPLTDPHENLYGSACELEYYWCSESGLGGHDLGVAPGESGLCEAFDGFACGDGLVELRITLGRDRQAACGF